MFEVLQHCYGKDGQFPHIASILAAVGENPGLSNPERQPRPRIVVFGDHNTGKTYLIEQLMNRKLVLPENAKNSVVTVYESSVKADHASIPLSQFSVSFFLMRDSHPVFF